MKPKTAAAWTSALFLACAPGVVAGLGPWTITHWHVRRHGLVWLPLQAGGILITVLGAIVLLASFLRFVTEGVGTPAPIAPTEQLVVGGLYRYVRNPMYVAVTLVIVGQAAVLTDPRLVIYAVAFAVVVALFVHHYEEPTLHDRYGTHYDAYRHDVPRWWPRRPRDTGTARPS